jgi:hypothetical protein
MPQTLADTAEGRTDFWGPGAGRALCTTWAVRECAWGGS